MFKTLSTLTVHQIRLNLDKIMILNKANDIYPKVNNMFLYKYKNPISYKTASKPNISATHLSSHNRGIR